MSIGSLLETGQPTSDRLMQFVPISGNGAVESPWRRRADAGGSTGNLANRREKRVLRGTTTAAVEHS